MIQELKLLNASRICGIISCVPSTIIDNAELGERLRIPNAKRLVAATGVSHRRVAPPTVRLSQYLYEASSHLLASLNWDKSSIDGIILITQSPDRRIPATSFTLHRKLELKSSCFAFDINLGCSAYPYGIWLSESLISESSRRILLMVGDLASRPTNPCNPSASFLFGDCATVTALEYIEGGQQKDIFILGSNGEGENLIELKDYVPIDSMSKRLETHYKSSYVEMDGKAVASFAIETVPEIIKGLNQAVSGKSKGLYHDYYLLHQANKHLLEHIRAKLMIRLSAMPININTYGNTASASIPLLITTELSNKVLEETMRVAMIGFGTGLSWSAVSKEIGPLDVCELIESSQI